MYVNRGIPLIVHIRIVKTFGFISHACTVHCDDKDLRVYVLVKDSEDRSRRYLGSMDKDSILNMKQSAFQR